MTEMSVPVPKVRRRRQLKVGTLKPVLNLRHEIEGVNILFQLLLLMDYPGDILVLLDYILFKN